MAGYGLYAGAAPGIQTAGANLMYGNALADQAQASEMKNAAETGLLMQRMKEVAAQAQRHLQDKGVIDAFPESARLSSAAQYGTTIPDMMNAERFLQGGGPGVGMTGNMDSGDMYTPQSNPAAMRAVSESRAAMLNPHSTTMSNVGTYRNDMAKVPGERAHGAMIEQVLQGFQPGASGPDLSRATDLAGFGLGHFAPAERDSTTSFEKNLEAAGIQRGSAEWNRRMNDLITKTSTHPSPTSINVMPPVNQLMREPASPGKPERFYYFQTSRDGTRQERVYLPEGSQPATAGQNPIDTMIGDAVRNKAPGAAGGNAAERALADKAIASGRDPAAVTKRYKERTGQDY